MQANSCEVFLMAINIITLLGFLECLNLTLDFVFTSAGILFHSRECFFGV